MTLLERLEATNTDPDVVLALEVVKRAALLPTWTSPQLAAALAPLLTEDGS